MRAILFVLALSFALPCIGSEVRAVLEPKEQTLITSEVNSTVKTIAKRMGESFQKDQDLILLNDVVFLANLLKAKAQMTKARTDFETAIRLYDDKVISHSEYREAEAALAVAEADLALARKSYDGCFIRAPYNGKVIDVFVKQYERVEPGQDLISILDDSILIARVLIPETYLGKLTIGDKVSVKIQETGTVEEATLVRMGAVLDPVSSLMKAEAEIDNADGRLRPGMEGMLMLTNDEIRRP